MEAIGVALAALGSGIAVLVLALKALSAERRAGDWHAHAAESDARSTALAAQLVDSTKREQEQKERGDRLDGVVSKLFAQIAAGPVAGAGDRLLQAAAAARTASADSARTVPGATAADPIGAGDTGLLKPGE